MRASLTHPIHVIDFEGSPVSGIVEFGIATLENGRITHSHSRLCRALNSIPWEETLVHGISTDETLTEPPFSAEWERFSGLRQTGPLSAHNARFEDMLLSSTWQLTQLSPNFIDPRKPLSTWGPWLDTCALYRRLYPSAPSHKLGSLIELFDLQDELDEVAREHCPPARRVYHAALYDAIAAALLIVRLLRCPEFSNVSLPWLIAHSSASARQLRETQQLELF
ncbi:MAG: hypothetical protein B7X06_02830 [Verrucomicrobia bacterium 21-51-4]|nr:MAG: hypothetical protein B7X06_02830 [Verrucomicrobia bacterium 21-51-4]HQU09362.1 3'-5' exonuclease [Opitutales bacterium]